MAAAGASVLDRVALVRTPSSQVAEEFSISRSSARQVLEVFGGVDLLDLQKHYNDYNLFGNGHGTLDRVSFGRVVHQIVDSSTCKTPRSKQVLKSSHFLDR